MGIIGIDIEQARRDDYAAIHSLLMRMAVEMAPAAVDHALVHARLEHVLAHGVCFLASVDGKPAGTIALLAEPMSWFTTSVVLRDTWCYVALEHRPLRVFGALMEACRDYAKQVSLPLHFQLFTMVDTTRKHRLFLRHSEKLISRLYRFTPMGAEYRIKRAFPE